MSTVTASASVTASITGTNVASLLVQRTLPFQEIFSMCNRERPLAPRERARPTASADSGLVCCLVDQMHLVVLRAKTKRAAKREVVMK